MARILVVEDEGLVLLLSEGILREAGHETKTATDVTEATALIEGEPPFDLLFTDIQLKDHEHGGLEIAQKLFEQQPSIRVIYATAATITDGMKSLFVEGAELLPKPYDPQTLVQAVIDALTRSSEKK